MIGRSWAIIFSSFGYNVQLFDVSPELTENAKSLIESQIRELHNTKSNRGQLGVEDQLSLISTTHSLKECLKSVIHVQESIFEDVALKQDLFKKIDDELEETNLSATLASSSSFAMPSSIFKYVEKHIDQCLVAHPINPPMFIRLVELVLHSKTRVDIRDNAKSLMTEVGQKPVVINKELNGFALNVLQTAIFHYGFSMISEGIISAEDLDTVVTEGLGPRYAFIGPWMTAHLNANGVDDYLRRYSNGLWSVLRDRPECTKMEGQVVEKISNSLNEQVPLDKLDEKRAWRDLCLKELDDTKSKLGR